MHIKQSNSVNSIRIIIIVLFCLEIMFGKLCFFGEIKRQNFQHTIFTSTNLITKKCGFVCICVGQTKNPIKSFIKITLKKTA